MEIDLLDDLRNNKNGEEVFEKLINFYLKMCGAISKGDVEKIIEFYDLDFSVEDINNLDLKIINDEYYSVHDDDIVRKIIDNRCDLTVRLLDYEELLKYCMATFSILKELSDVLNNDKIGEKILLSEMAMALFTSLNYSDDMLCELFSIRNDEVDEVKNILEKYDDDIRYWHIYGRTFVESDFDNIIDDMLMTGKPNDDSILSCIEKLSDKGLNNLEFVYETKDRKKLVKFIVDSFIEDVNLTKQEYALLCNNDIINYHYDDDFFFSGYIYVYEEDGKKYVIVPKEIKDVLKTINKNDLKSDDIDNDLKKFNNLFNVEINNMNIVSGYIAMNGLIKNSVLKDLMKDRHDITLTIQELDDIIDSLGYDIIDDYYSFGFDDDEIKDLIEIKENNKDYKTYDEETIKIDDEFFCAVDKFTDENYKEYKDDLMRIIVEGVKYVAMTEDNIKPFCDDISLGNQDIKKIMDIVEPYKNIVPTWIFNGYSVVEKYNSLKNEKFKNMYCPCGSGKDYKDCCGKYEEDF